VDGDTITYLLWKGLILKKSTQKGEEKVRYGEKKKENFLILQRRQEKATVCDLFLDWRGGGWGEEGKPAVSEGPCPPMVVTRSRGSRGKLQIT